MSIRNLLAESRRSGPALVVRDCPDGTREIVEVRPARSPYHAKRLTPEERLAILTQTGAWPDDFPADAWCGVQANDHYGSGASQNPMPHGVLRGIQDRPATPEEAAGQEMGLWNTGIMSGFRDDDST